MPYSWVGPEPVPGQVESGSVDGSFVVDEEVDAVAERALLFIAHAKFTIT